MTETDPKPKPSLWARIAAATIVFGIIGGVIIPVAVWLWKLALA